MRHLAVLCLLAAACSATREVPPQTTAALTEAPSTPVPVNAWVEPAREVLIRSCGNCHQPELPTSDPRALAVFDLREPEWYARMSEDQLRGMQARVLESRSLAAEDKSAVEAFVSCKLSGACAN